MTTTQHKLEAGMPPQLMELATRIFVDLTGRTIVLAEGAVKMPVSADNLAKLSFKLAHAFYAVQDELNAASMPKNPTFKLGSDDIAEWMK
jgi:hypothetical protein